MTNYVIKAIFGDFYIDSRLRWVNKDHARLFHSMVTAECFAVLNDLEAYEVIAV